MSTYARSTYARSVDANQAEIVAALRGCGVAVVDLSAVGHGVPDLLAADIAGTFLVEVKTATGRLRDTQRRFADSWPGDLYVIRDVDDAIDVATRRRNRAIERRLF